MKRFYSDVDIAAADTGFAITLDGRPVKTPGRAPLTLPNAELADAIAAEWRAQGEEIDPRSMALTGLANAAIDVVGADRSIVVGELAAYAETDTLVYRSDDSALAARQGAEWNPLLSWAEVHWDIQFTLGTGIMHVAQPPETVAALKRAVAALNAWRLTALSPLTTLGGSLVVALGVIEGIINPDHGFAAVTLEERFQEERWGADSDATIARAAREAEWQAAARFAYLVGDGHSLGG